MTTGPSLGILFVMLSRVSILAQKPKINMSNHVNNKRVDSKSPFPVAFETMVCANPSHEPLLLP